jgi:hypothetical protein
MKVTRRDCIKKFHLTGTSLFSFPLPSYAKQKKDEGWRPAYEKLEQEGKYMDAVKAAKYSAGASDYPEVTKRAIIKMHRQFGRLKIDKRGIALMRPNSVATRNLYRHRRSN